jgi:hypothetical protein
MVMNVLMDESFDIQEFELVEMPSAAYDFIEGVVAGIGVVTILMACGC